MKPVLKFIVCILVTVIIAFLSCTKKETVSSNINSQSPRIDTLKGHEFVFDLIWREDWDLASSVLYTEYRPDLFFDPLRAMDVSIRLDTLSTWYSVARLTNPLPPGYLYFYGNDFGFLYVYPYGSASSLTGSRASLKVKFL